MKSTFLPALGLLLLGACQNPDNGKVKIVSDDSTHKETLNGTYRLVSNIIITKGDTAHEYPVPNREMVKMFNGTHFAFFQHDLTQGKDKDSMFVAGQGTFTLNGDKYGEHLTYCTARSWENHDFNDFTLQVHGDTLVQQGIEKDDHLHVDHLIVETYVKVH